MTKLVGLKIQFQYKKRSKNIVAYALSRVGRLLAVTSTSPSQPICLQEVTNYYTMGPMAHTML